MLRRELVHVSMSVALYSKLRFCRNDQYKFKWYVNVSVGKDKSVAK